MSESVAVKLNYQKGYQSKVQFDFEGIPSILLDEPKPVGEGLGPSSTMLLSAAIGQCLTSSLIYCLQKIKVTVKNLETTVNLYTSRNDEGRIRVKNIDVQIHLEVEEKDQPRVPRCLEIFENYCTVTQSVMKGIEINLKIN